jgi:hypothetical protein
VSSLLFVTCQSKGIQDGVVSQFEIWLLERVPRE